MLVLVRSKNVMVKLGKVHKPPYGLLPKDCSRQGDHRVILVLPNRTLV